MFEHRTVAAATLVLLLLAASVRPADGQCGATIDLGRGPILFHVPFSYDPQRPTPLIVALHGYRSSAREMVQYVQLLPVAEELGLLVAYPEGTLDAIGNRFWDATEVCCGDLGPDRDDSAYLRRLVERIQADCNVDPRRIYFTGHSNGAYMSYRMACEHADLIAGIVPIAGVTETDPRRCRPSQPVHVLHVHGTADEIWNFDGGSIRGLPYLGAPESVERWAELNGCAPRLLPAPERLDLDLSLPGPDTDVDRIAGCRPGGSVELWSILGADHTPAFDRDFGRRIADYLLERGRSCRGAERLARAACRRRGRLKLSLRGGLPRDAYRVELDTGATLRGTLDGGGNARARFLELRPGPGTATVIWGCGHRETVTYTCS